MDEISDLNRSKGVFDISRSRFIGHRAQTHNPPFLLQPHRDLQHFQEVRYGNIRKCLWLTLENPGYSIPSKLFSLVSIGVVLTSIATMCINSIPEYQVGPTVKD